LTTTTTLTDTASAAEAIGLCYVSDATPGIRRRRRGNGFSYAGPGGETVRDVATLARIRSLTIPPAWSEVWICLDPNGHIQATGRDAKGRKQYRYHPQWSLERNLSKYARLIAFSEALPAIRQRVERDLARPGLPREKVIATVVRLLETTFIRIGNREYAKANRSFGLTTLRDRHVEIKGSRVNFHFVGKSGKEHTIEIRDRRLAGIIKRCRAIPGHALFQYIDDDGRRQTVDSGDVNRYLREACGDDYTAKDFRTWGGTLLALRELRQLPPPASAAKAKRTVSQMVQRVSSLLGNRPATCRKYYVHPAVLDAYLDGSLAAAFSEVSGQLISDAPHDLDFEEAALLTLLRDRQDQDGAGLLHRRNGGEADNHRPPNRLLAGAERSWR
jgi:DNA topoisomerase I